MKKGELYAPIIIPTMNRYVHLQRCIHSLSLNTGADKTDLYVSVDFPSSEKYIQDHEKVVEYLKTTKDLRQFHNTFIYYQKYNLGAAANTMFLKKKIDKTAKCYIYSEDDNEFSPNFLIYINQGLRIYEHDERVISINAMKDADWIIEDGNNVVASKLSPAYGCGYWFEKEEKIHNQINELLLAKSSLSMCKMAKLYKENKYIFALYMNGVICNDSGLFWLDGKVGMCDTTSSIYMYLGDKFCIVPAVSKSRTWGNDGTGMTMPKNININPEKRWILDNDTTFEFKDKKIEYNKKNNRIAEKFLTDVFGKKLIRRAILEYLLLIILGLDRKKILRIKRRIMGLK